jgi:glycosyltransferase involved in cell wall biosynthesis
MSFKLAWGSKLTRAEGNSYGYFKHDTNLRAATAKVIQLYDADPTDIIYIFSPEFFRGKPEGSPVRLWLFTMFEGTTLPMLYQERMAKADYLLAPSKWVKKNFDKYFPTEKSFVVPHGVDPLFSYKQRRFPKNRPFRFLWVGAPNPRKGYEEVAVVWQEVFSKFPGLELYVKTTLVEGVQRKANVILDGRNLSDRDMMKLYHSADAFLFPTRGEGFGLTLAEAMRTGLPCVATEYSGVTDFFDSSVGYPVPYTPGKGEVTYVGEGMEGLKEETTIAYPDVEKIATAMMEILNDYPAAVRRGFQAHRRMCSYTWAASARALINAIEGASKSASPLVS